MCGIIGYIGKKCVEEELIEGLKKLEYRGYDSAGITVLNNDFIVTKALGRISNLDKVLEKNSNASIGIAHTRWATHGSVTIENTHPHLSYNGNWAVVHNGIIENYKELRSLLSDRGVEFKSETDTEVIPNLCEYYESNDYLLSFIKACNQLQGSYAISCINKLHNDTMFLAKQKISLYVAVNESEVFVASDPICFVGKVNKYYSLEDGEFCKAQVGKLLFVNKNGEELNKFAFDTDTISVSIGKGIYDHYMLKEIEEIPSVLKRIVDVYSNENALLKLDSKYLHSTNKIIIIGCGTAYHAGLMGEKYIEKYTGIDTECFIASEFRYMKFNITKDMLFLFISQSGETADTLACLEIAKLCGCRTIALTNVAYSTLAKNVDIVLPVCAGPEIAVASTKAYSAQVMCLYIISKHIESVQNNQKINLIEVDLFVNKFKLIDFNCVESVMNVLKYDTNIVFIGKNYDYISSLEANLKLKEITYINSSAYPAGELKHGYIALIDNKSLVFVIATEKELLEKTLNSAYESNSRGAKIIFVSQFDVPNNDFIHIKLDSFDEDFMPIVAINFFQYLSYKVSVSKGINPDQPRNLAKSVTVE